MEEKQLQVGDRVRVVNPTVAGTGRAGFIVGISKIIRGPRVCRVDLDEEEPGEERWVYRFIETDLTLIGRREGSEQ